jgi:putative MFS transporter
MGRIWLWWNRQDTRSGGLAFIVGGGDYHKPDAPLPQISSAFLYLGCWSWMAGAMYYFFGLETRGKSIEEIDRELVATA